MRTEMLLYFAGINFFCHPIDTEIECILYVAQLSRARDIQVHNVWKEGRVEQDNQSPNQSAKKGLEV